MAFVHHFGRKKEVQANLIDKRKMKWLDAPLDSDRVSPLTGETAPLQLDHQGKGACSIVYVRSHCMR